MNFSEKDYPHQEESYEIIGLCMEVHRVLGPGLLEIVYKDALEYELKSRKLKFVREKKYEVEYKEIILPHHFYADFVINNKIILEIKAQTGVANEHYAQVINYLAISKCKVGLIVNFGEKSLVHKRVIL